MLFPSRSASLPILAELTTGESPAVKPAQKMRQAILQKFHRFTAARAEHVLTSPEPVDASHAAPPTGLKLWFEPNEAVAEYIKPKRRPIDAVLTFDFELTLYSLIFVHGLQGHRDRTWTGPSAQSPWPRDILPDIIPNVRVLTFGYDSSVTRWDRMVSKNTVNDHALGLMNSIATYREADNTVSTDPWCTRSRLTCKHDRPLLFICHSLGGLVCQQVCTANNSPCAEAEYS